MHRTDDLPRVGHSSATDMSVSSAMQGAAKL
jgi:hypothetical protein